MPLTARTRVSPAHPPATSWHNLVPRVPLGSASFTVGYVPVTVDLYGELNGAAWASEPIDATIGVGMQFEAEMRRA